MTRRLVALALLCVVGAPPLHADHLVSPARVRATLADASEARAAGLAWTRRALPQLTDAELRELAARAEALEADPTAGQSHQFAGSTDPRKAALLLSLLWLIPVVVVLVKGVDVE